MPWTIFPTNRLLPELAFGLHAGSQRGFSLTTANGVRYVCKGDHDTLLSHNGKRVEVKETMKATKKTFSKPATFPVSEVKKLADFCQ